MLLSNTDLALAFSAWDLLFALVLVLGVAVVVVVLLGAGEVAYAGRTSPSLLSFWLNV